MVKQRAFNSQNGDRYPDDPLLLLEGKVYVHRTFAGGGMAKKARKLWLSRDSGTVACYKRAER
jgi:hypothetical protein